MSIEGARGVGVCDMNTISYDNINLIVVQSIEH